MDIRGGEIILTDLEQERTGFDSPLKLNSETVSRLRTIVELGFMEYNTMREAVTDETQRCEIKKIHELGRKASEQHGMLRKIETRTSRQNQDRAA